MIIGVRFAVIIITNCCEFRSSRHWRGAQFRVD